MEGDALWIWLTDLLQRSRDLGFISIIIVRWGGANGLLGESPALPIKVRVFGLQIPSPEGVQQQEQGRHAHLLICIAL